MNEWMDAEGHADKALEMYERGRWAEAESELRKALALNPDHAEWHFNLGLTLEASGRDADALASYRRSIDLMPDEAEPHFAAAVVANRLGRYTDAVAWLEKVLRIDPHAESAYAHKIESHLRLGQHDEAETTFYLAQQMLDEPSAQCHAMMAESLLARGKFERAEWCLREALRLDATYPRVRARLAGVFAATGRRQRAAQLFLRELRDNPGCIETLLDYAHLLVELGQLADAGEKARRVLELEPANVDAHALLGRIALEARRDEQAHIEFELVQKLDPDYQEIDLWLAETLLRLGRADEARTHLQRRLAAAEASETVDEPGLEAQPEPMPVPLETHRWFGSLLLEADEPASAAKVLTDVAQRDDFAELPVATRAEIWRQVALARFRSDDRAAGCAASTEALRLDPNCVVSMHNLALNALIEHRLGVASGWIARGLSVNPHDDNLRRLRIRVWIAVITGFFRQIRLFLLGR